MIQLEPLPPREKPSSNYSSSALSRELRTDKGVSEFDTLSVPRKPKGTAYGTATEELTQKVARLLTDPGFFP